MKCSYHHSISGNIRHKKIKGEVCKFDVVPLDLVGSYLVGNSVILQSPCKHLHCLALLM